MAIDVDALWARIRARQATDPQESHDQEAVNVDLETLLSALEEARADVKRLSEEHDDLRESAEIWIRLYDASILRANRAEGDLKRLRRDLPTNVQHLYDALDRVAILTEAINRVVKDCDVCARTASDSPALSEKTMEACVRCQSALDALRSAAGLAPSDP